MAKEKESSEMTAGAARFDWTAVRERLAASNGPAYWRSLEELAEDEEFLRFVRAEFPEPAALLESPVSRRRFLQLMGASLALAGLNACTRQPTEKIFPYVDQPEQVVPGQPLYYATAFTLGGSALGILAESHLGRPTKIEGNELHPASLGATDVFAQAHVLDLYDPDRSQVVMRAGEIASWKALTASIRETMREIGEGAQGEGLRVLTPAVTSPTFAALMRKLLAKYPKAKWHRWEPVHRDNARRASELAFGEMLDVRYEPAKAEVIAAFDADVLAWGPGGVRYAREFAARRKPDGGADMNRLYVIESTPTTTGAKADHRLARRPQAIEACALWVAAELGLEIDRPALDEHDEAWLRALTLDLQRVRGRSLVVAGDWASPLTHAAVHWINRTLGNVGTTLSYIEPVEADPVLHEESIAELMRDMHAGRVRALFILDGNPVYDAPRDLEFADALRNVAVVYRHGLYDDETSYHAHWHIPQAHALETWGDARAFDGTVTIQQPLILPLYAGKSPLELLALILGESDAPDGHELVRAYWRERRGEAGFEELWRRSLHDGVVDGTAAPVRRPRLRADFAERIGRLRAEQRDAVGGQTAIDVVLRPDPHIYDGRFANNGWLQELPKPHTKLVWENAALVAPALAEREGIGRGDVVAISVGERTVEAPVWITPGQPDGVVTLHLGYGRERVGRVGNRLGVDAYRLRTVGFSWSLPGAHLRRTGRRVRLVTTQDHHSMEGRPLVHRADIETYRRDPDFVHAHAGGTHEHLSLYPEHPYDGYAWGMTIDLSACIGCNACTIACQAENNIAVVGKEQVDAGREMHWIRVDRYFEGDLANPTVHHQPVPCMHCENAPCEVVCPVNATVHSDEGLNDMVYNRCVGTRYCSNNCPYKVRRFNFFLYSDWTTETLKMQRNPDVTVRSRGVMEKCTYCVQRISQARITAKKEGRKIRDGEVVTACQQVCPADAIVFGDINDRDSRVAAEKRKARNYSLLGELGTKPRTTYLAEIRNPNPDVEKLEATV